MVIAKPNTLLQCYEGLLILGAAIGIISAAVNRLLHPRELEAVGARAGRFHRGFSG